MTDRCAKSTRAGKLLQCYVPALLITGGVVAVSWLLVQLFGMRSVAIYLLLLFLAGILGAAWFGYGPGILVTLLLCLPAMYLLVPHYSVRQTKWTVMAVLLFFSSVVSRISEGRHLKEAALRRSNATLDARVKERTIELERANEKLARQLAELDTLYKKLPLGVAFFDPGLRFVRLNEKLADIGGEPVANHIGRDFREMVPPPLADIIEPMLRQALQSGEPLLEYECHGQRRNQPRLQRDWSIACSRVTTDDGAIHGFQVIVQDITDRKAAETALRRANADLAQFAYIAAHDLQEPLRTVVIFSQLVERRCAGALDVEAQGHLRCVVAAAMRMNQMITDVLAYSQASSEKRTITQAVDLEEVVNSVLESIKASIAATSAQILRDPLPVVQGDPARLGQVFQNLFGNAIKYHRAGVPPRIHIKANRQKAEWIISVVDNGQGFKQEYAEQVFGVFKRLQSRDISGSGIGLAICKTVIDSHGGRVWAESQEGQGSTFYFTLPAK